VPLTRKSTKRRAVSRVTGAVFLVAIALSVSIMATRWMTEATTSRMGFERVEIQAVWAKSVTTIPRGWEINLIVRNSGCDSATLSKMYLNSKTVPLTDPPGTGVVLGSLTTDLPENGIYLPGGASSTVTVWVPHGIYGLTAGTGVDILICGTSGTDYCKLIKLP